VLRTKKEADMLGLTNRGKKAWPGKILFFIAALSILLAFSDPCSTRLKDVLSPKELVDLLDRVGFVPLPIPGSHYQPGSIVKVVGENVDWIDDLTSCGFPLSEFQVKPYTPGIEFTKAVEFGASAIINVKGISAGPGFNRVSKVRFEIIEHAADAFRLIKLRIWSDDPENQSRINKACMDALLEPDTYLINEAYRISKGKYTLYDKSGAAIKIDTPVLKELLQIQPDVKYEVTSEGSMVIEQPVYFAIKNVQRVGQHFEALSRDLDEPDTADNKIKRIFLQTAGRR
jgi:hypothetical protein